MNGTQLSQEASDKTLFVAGARMCTKAPDCVCWESGPLQVCARSPLRPGPGETLFGHKVPQHRCREINVTQSGCKVFPESERKWMPGVRVSSWDPLPQKACSGILRRFALRFETSLVRESWAGTTWGTLISPSCWWVLVFNHSEAHSSSAFTTHSHGHILTRNSLTTCEGGRESFIILVSSWGNWGSGR